jgi:hypothetical protein
MICFPAIIRYPILDRDSSTNNDSQAWRIYFVHMVTSSPGSLYMARIELLQQNCDLHCALCRYYTHMYCKLRKLE